MLLTIVLHQPQMLGTFVRHTPAWAGGLLAVLLVLGASQLRERTAGLARVSLMPLAMTLFSAWGTMAAFGSAPNAAAVLAVWLATTVAVALAVAPGRSAAAYDAARREYRVPGSWAPLLLIAGIFLAKWWVGVELALQPQLVRDAGFALPVAALYGVFSGLFVGRAARLWRLAVPQRAIA